MGKIDRLLQALNMEQALDRLRSRDGSPTTDEVLLRLCEEQQLSAYVDIYMPGVAGTLLNSKETVTLYGLHQVLNPAVAFNPSLRPACVVIRYGAGFWTGLLPQWSSGALFRAVDIQALADKMNGADSQPIAADFESQHLQLEKAQADLEAAKASYEILRKHNRDTHQLWESTQAENTQLRKALTDSKCIEGECRHHQGQQPEHQTEAPATGLTFPYATTHLEAMHTAALKYWANHTPEKRQPTQREVGYELCELLGLALQASKEPARKAVSLATAIRPDTLPDA